MTLNQQIQILKQEIERLKSKVAQLSSDIEGKNPSVYSKVGGTSSRALNRPIGISSGLGVLYGGAVIWNDAESKVPPFGEKPNDPTIGYNKHSHSCYSGGALDINTLELVEYNVIWEGDSANPTSTLYNKHCQSLWRDIPDISKDDEDNEKIGGISDNLVWDTTSESWRFYAVYKDEPES